MSDVDPEKDLLIPALEGTKNILQAISAHAPQVKRVVITSSFAAIVDMHQGARPGHTYTEEDWNPETYEVAKTADGATAYCASKTFAERAAFDYVKEANAPFSVSTICPPMVYGPVEHGVTSIAKLNTSSADIYRLMNGSEKDVPQTSFYAFCDVRDVAEAHLKAYQKDEAANQRFFVTGGSYSYQIICDILRKTFPELRDRVPEGKPGSGLGADVYKVDNSKAKRVLSLNFRSLEECIVDTVKSLLEVEKAEKAGKA
jgi:nucleoside-diphosphate-sugar epimerase